MRTEDLRQLLGQREGLKLDFKRELYKIDKSKYSNSTGRKREWDELVKDILALTNGNIGVADQPAHLVIGAGDKLKSDGTRDLFDVGEVGLTPQQILDRVNESCAPPVPKLDCEIVVLDGCRLFIILIPPSPHLHETTRWLQTPKKDYNPGTVFIRRGEGTFPASASERQAIREDKRKVFLHIARPELIEAEKQRFLSEQIQTHRERLAKTVRYARWADRSSDESYISSHAVRLPLFVSPYGEIGGFVEELQACIHSYQRLLILGEPGMGKTVALERTTWELSTADSRVVPVFVPLIQYDVSLMHSVMTALNESSVLSVATDSELEQLVHDWKCVFLFDGLNEVAGNRRDKLYAELASFLRTHSSSPCIITSRSQDDLWRRFHSREMIEDAVVVRRITEEQIVGYLQSHLGQKKGNELHDRLNQALRGLARIPLLLWLIKEAGLAGEELPGNRGELFDRFVKRVLEREQKQPDLVTIPVHQKMWALSHLAFSLLQGQRLACSHEEAVRVTQEALEGTDGRAVVQESLRNGLLMGETHVHFMHHAVLEYFAALRLAGLVSSFLTSEDRVLSNLRGLLSGADLRRQLRRWAKEDWWAEAIVQLSGLTHEPAFIAKQVLRSNPWLAYWCSIEGKPLSVEMQGQIERQTVARLCSPKYEERLRVISELARMENPRTIGHLIVALGDSSEAVQELASQTLARLGEPAVNHLLESLPAANAGTRRAATRTLGAIWRFPEITKLGAEQNRTRQLAAKTLGNLGDDRAIAPLIACLKDTAQVRIRAAEALGRLGDVRAVEPLMEALERSYAYTRSDESAIIARALASLGERTDEYLLSGLRDLDAQVRRRALLALAETWRLPLVGELADSDPETRRRAARRLGETSDERVVEPLLAALKDPEQTVRWEATRALGRFWQSPTLIELGDENEQVRQAAARALLKSSDTSSIEPLIAALRDRDSKVRGLASEALGELGEVAIAPLAAFLYCEEREMRRSIGSALAKIDSDRVIEILEPAFYDKRWWVREAAAESLVKLGDRAVPVLEAALESQDSDVCRLARFTLRRIGTIRAQAALAYRYRKP
jgi:HEAT repeat protein